jgi:hypothetical protein
MPDSRVGLVDHPMGSGGKYVRYTRSDHLGMHGIPDSSNYEGRGGLVHFKDGSFGTISGAE